MIIMASPNPVIWGRSFVAAIAFLAIASGAVAEKGGSNLANFSGGANDPVIIEADDGIEWRQKQRVYIARGNARAMRGDVSVTADTLTAHYRETGEGKTDIWKVVAEGNVVITSKDRRIEGDIGTYDVETGAFVLLGKNLRLSTPTETITASDRIEYRSRENIALIIGNAIAIRDDKKIKANRFVARFRENQSGEMKLHQVDATGNVVIVTRNEIARADRGVYNATSGIATLIGSVKLTRGDSQLNGARAEVDMNSGVSRLLADPSGKGRVRGLFMPGRDGNMKLQLPDGPKQ